MHQPADTSNDTYNRDFADYYDRITKHKDYHAEIRTLAEFIRSVIPDPNPSILDVGCGTGNHAALLAETGPSVTAIDLSPDMIRIAKSKNTRVKFMSGDIAEMEATGFHFSYSLFNVVNCLDSIPTLIAFLKAISARLIDGGGFLVEAWNPIAIIAAPPEIVERTYEYDDETIVRKVVPASELLNQRLDLQYYIDVYSRDSRPIKIRSFSVVHRLVLFTPLEIEYALKEAGFKNVNTLTALPEMAPAGPHDRMLAFTCQK